MRHCYNEKPEVYEVKAPSQADAFRELTLLAEEADTHRRLFNVVYHGCGPDDTGELLYWATAYLS